MDSVFLEMSHLSKYLIEVQIKDIKFNLWPGCGQVHEGVGAGRM